MSGCLLCLESWTPHLHLGGLGRQVQGQSCWAARLGLFHGDLGLAFSFQSNKTKTTSGFLNNDLGVCLAFYKLVFLFLKERKKSSISMSRGGGSTTIVLGRYIIMKLFH
uniref:Uncharacterized protein n=1 Tax=Zea mays TaxID=4577 RepID=A0A804NY17_MAIZE